MVNNKNKLLLILGLVITIIISFATNLSKVNYIDNPIHLLEFHKLELTSDFKTASYILSNQSGEATVSDWNRLLDKIKN